MHIALVHREQVPPLTYGGTERIIYWLGGELARQGHTVTLLAPPGSLAPFGTLRPLDRAAPLEPQIPTDADVIHFHFLPPKDFARPHVITNHGNLPVGLSVPRNTVFVSENHARRHNATCFVRNGVDPAEYGPVDFARPRPWAHFLGKAAWRRKNVRGAIQVARKAGLRLMVMGGTRLNFNMGFRLTLDPRVSFAGMVGGAKKLALLAQSRGMIFPVRWHDPCPVAVIESLYFGCPVIGTPYGSLPELVPEGCGVLSTSRGVLADAARALEPSGRRRCHEWVLEALSVRVMADAYLRLYQRVMDGESLNPTEPKATESFSNALPWLP